MVSMLEEKKKALDTGNEAGPVERPEPSERPDPLVKEVTFRIPLPIAVPLLALLGIAVVAGLFALFLLSISHEQAPAVALALAVNIMAAATYAAAKPKMSGRTIAELAVLVIYPVALAVVLVNVGVGETATHEGSETAAPVAAAAAPAAEPQPEEIERVRPGVLHRRADVPGRRGSRALVRQPRRGPPQRLDLRERHAQDGVLHGLEHRGRGKWRVRDPGA